MYGYWKFLSSIILFLWFGRCHVYGGLFEKLLRYFNHMSIVSLSDFKWNLICVALLKNPSL